MLIRISKSEKTIKRFTFSACTYGMTKPYESSRAVGNKSCRSAGHMEEGEGVEKMYPSW